jgi:hypothetical protein
LLGEFNNHGATTGHLEPKGEELPMVRPSAGRRPVGRQVWVATLARITSSETGHTMAAPSNSQELCCPPPIEETPMGEERQ